MPEHPGQARFVLFIWLIWFIWFVSFNKTNETNQINQITVFFCWLIFQHPGKGRSIR